MVECFFAAARYLPRRGVTILAAARYLSRRGVTILAAAPYSYRRGECSTLRLKYYFAAARFCFFYTESLGFLRSYLAAAR